MRCLDDDIINKNSAHNDIKITRFNQIIVINQFDSASDNMERNLIEQGTLLR